ncbi:MAG: acetyl-CoA carboxylase carboxyltransferase subunit alpha [Peptococcaceae bacterium]|jgi:acetyl-CoA carboxylase carboxyl transferase subunit alpha|nr:acetyl-CoA carboxylase carboxyltransferase subunit alpha [Peptococcaceae bacterium]
MLLFDFEKPLFELEKKIAELKKFSAEKGIDLGNEVRTLELRADELKGKIYDHLEPWQCAQVARHPERPNFFDYVPYLFEDFIELRGDRHYADDRSIAAGIAVFQGTPVTVVAQVKGKDTKENLQRNFGMPHPEGYRKALRLMEQAEKFRRPILTFIDTPGAACDLSAEERGQGEAIARCLIAMARFTVPVISTIIGEGGSGGALALAAGDLLLMLEHSYFSVIAPESCANILWKDVSRAREASTALKYMSKDLYQLKIVDRIIKEPIGGAHRNHRQSAESIGQALAEELQRLQAQDPQSLRDQRYQKIRAIGVFSEGTVNATETVSPT